MSAGGVLVARHGEVAFFDRVLDSLASGSGLLIEVAGEPGIGKSRLLAELGTRADERGYVVLSGRAAQFEHEAPFAVFVDALDGYLASLGPEFLGRLGPQVLGELATAFPSLAALGGDHQPALQAERFRTHRAVGVLLDELGRAHPTVVVLDDVHWADPAARELLGHLLAYPPRAPVLVAMALRPAQTPAALSRALAAACRDGRAHGLELGPLSEADAGELVGAALSARARAELFRDSGGNPFYLEQLVRAVGSSWRGSELTVGAEDAIVPAPVRAALAAELDFLAPEARRFLDGAAVAGDPFEPDLAATVAGLDDAGALELLDAVVGTDLVRPTTVPRRFRFRQPIVRRAVYESTGAGWRMGAHARAADALAAAGTSAPVLAHHVERSAAAGDEQALVVLLEAAAATAPRAPATAAHWYGAALRLLGPDDPRSLQLLVARATALGAAGQFEDSHAAVTDALHRLPPGPGSLRVNLTAFAAGIETITGNNDRARDRLLHALAGLAEPGSIEAAALQVELSVLAAFSSDWHQMATWAEEALATSRQRGHQPTEAVTAALRAYATAALREPRSAELVTEAAQVFDALDDGRLAQRLDAAVYLAWAEALLERFDQSKRHLDRAVAVSRATGQGQFLPPLFLGQLVPLMWRGRITEASELSEAAVEASRLGAPVNLLAWALFGLAWASTYLGELDRAIALGEEATELLRDREPTIVSAAADMWLGLSLLEVNEAGRAREKLVQAIQGPALPRFGGAVLYELLTRAEVALGNLDAADRWVTDAEAAIGPRPMDLEASYVGRARAGVLLARGNACTAADVALDAAERADRVGSPIESARARVLAARALAKAGDRPRAVAELEVAENVLSDAGARGFATEALSLLRRLGRREIPRRNAMGGVASLTDREREIAQLVAAGRTNRQIAAACYLSPKTVERHLSNIFAKLGVPGRSGVARIIAREPTNDRG